MRSHVGSPRPRHAGRAVAARDDHEEILRARERLHRLESTLQALRLEVKQMRETLTEVLPPVRALLADIAYEKRRRTDTIRSLVRVGKFIGGVGAAAVTFLTVWQLTPH